MGKVENMGVITQEKRHEGKMFEKQHKTTKMNEHKKRPSKEVTLICAHG